MQLIKDILTIVILIAISPLILINELILIIIFITMKAKKRLAYLQARIKQWENQKNKQGFKKPGSQKK